MSRQDPDPIKLIVGLHGLLQTFADYLCDCRDHGNRNVDLESHDDHCTYKQVAQGKRK